MTRDDDHYIDLCVACGRLAQGIGPAVSLCSRCGSKSCEELRTFTANRRAHIASTVDHRGETPFWFAGAMLYKLAQNSAKGSWTRLDFAYLMRCLDQEVTELREALTYLRCYEQSPQCPRGRAAAVHLILEAADVANFAMMLADKARTDAALTVLDSVDWPIQVQAVDSW